MDVSGGMGNQSLEQQHLEGLTILKSETGDAPVVFNAFELLSDLPSTDDECLNLLLMQGDVLLQYLILIIVITNASTL